MRYANIQSLLTSKTKYLILVLPIFILNPTLGFIWSTLLLLSYRNRDEIIPLFLFFIAFYISLINMTKIPESDQSRYLECFNLCKSYNFIDVCKYANNGEMKEQIYYLYTSILFKITFGNRFIFFFLTSMLIYSVLLSSIYNFGKLISTKSEYIIAGVFVVVFFTQFFGLSLHIIRQILATVLVIYAIVYKIKYQKNNYLLLIIALLIHSSLIFLIILSLIPAFYKRISKRNGIIIILSFSLFIILFGTLGNYFVSLMSGNFMIYLFSRMKDDAADATDGAPISIILIILIPLIIVALKLILFDIPKGKYPIINPNGIQPIYPFTHIFLLLAFFVISFTKAPLIQYRFLFICYPFIGFILPYFLPPRSKCLKPYLIFISIFMIVRFFLTYNNGSFTYISLEDLLIKPIFYYFSTNFYPISMPD